MRNCSDFIVGLSLVWSGLGWAGPIISEVAWMGTQANYRDEWLELYNPDENPVQLADYELRAGSEILPLPAVEMAPGSYLVLEDDVEATSLVPDAALQFSISLANAGEVLRLCPVGRSAETELCDIAHSGVGDWPAGNNDSKHTMVRVEPWVLGQPGVFRTWNGEPSAVVDRLGDPIFGTPGEGAVWPEIGEDAGPGPTADAGAGGEVDAGPLPPHAYAGLAITEIYFNPPTSSETGKEWVEIANFSERSIALDGTLLDRLEGANEPVVRRSTMLSGTGLTLAPGDYVVLSQTTDLDVGICVGGNLQVVGSANLQLANSGTQWLRISGDGFSNTVKYAGAGVPTLAEGVALALASPNLDNTDTHNWSAAECTFAEGLFGSPGVANDACALEAVLPCGSSDAGPADTDAGLPTDPVVLGPNASPTLELRAPANDVSSEGFVEITYSASDPDADDSLEVLLYYDLDGNGFDGVRIASGLPAGESQSYRWRTQGVAPGTYRIFGVVRDVRGASAFAYAPGAVSIGGGTHVDRASIRMIEPDGVNDARSEDGILLRWEVDMPADAEGSVSLFYDVDQSGEDGEPILASIPVWAEDGAAGPREYMWKHEGVPAGQYTVYAVLNWTRGQEAAYSAYFRVAAGESCAALAPVSGIWLAALVLFGMTRRRRRPAPER